MKDVKKTLRATFEMLEEIACRKPKITLVDLDKGDPVDFNERRKLLRQYVREGWPNLVRKHLGQK